VSALRDFAGTNRAETADLRAAMALEC